MSVVRSVASKSRSSSPSLRPARRRSPDVRRGRSVEDPGEPPVPWAAALVELDTLFLDVERLERMLRYLPRPAGDIEVGEVLLRAAGRRDLSERLAELIEQPSAAPTSQFAHQQVVG
ncbi:MAG: hypothetical protein U0169_14615 [Polyangiaceae bacterium]